eukprot:IDg18970t1
MFSEVAHPESTHCAMQSSLTPSVDVEQQNMDRYGKISAVIRATQAETSKSPRRCMAKPLILHATTDHARQLKRYLTERGFL